MKTVRLIVHLGMHKTGSTSIQQYLHDNTYALYLAGIQYPSTGRHPLAAVQHALIPKIFDSATPLGGSFSLNAPIDGELLIRALRHEVDISGSSTVILSSEEFSRFDVEMIEDFGRTFADFELCPVIFVRNFPDLIDSYYGTFIMYSTSTSEPWGYPVPTDLFGPAQAWASISADKAIRVVDFDASPSGDSVQDFLTACDWDPAAFPSSAHAPRLNPSLSPALIALVRDLRGQGVAEQHLHGLVSQLGQVRFREPQTNLSDQLTRELTDSYASVFQSLRSAPFVRWLGTSATPPTRSTTRIHIANLAAAVFALGRALGDREPD